MKWLNFAVKDGRISVMMQVGEKWCWSLPLHEGEEVVDGKFLPWFLNHRILTLCLIGLFAFNIVSFFRSFFFNQGQELIFNIYNSLNYFFLCICLFNFLLNYFFNLSFFFFLLAAWLFKTSSQLIFLLTYLPACCAWVLQKCMWNLAPSYNRLQSLKVKTVFPALLENESHVGAKVQCRFTKV